jgi:hypothetical protein
MDSTNQDQIGTVAAGSLPGEVVNATAAAALAAEVHVDKEGPVTALEKPPDTLGVDYASQGKIVAQFALFMTQMYSFAGRASYRSDRRYFEWDTDVDVHAKTDPGSVHSLRMGCGNLETCIRHGCNAPTQCVRWIMEVLPDIVYYIGTDIIFLAEVAAYFSQELVLMAANQIRDWRRLAARLGGSFRGFNPDNLQGIIPILAPTARKVVMFEELAYKIWLNVMAAWLVEVDGGFDKEDYFGTRYWQDFATTMALGTMNTAHLISAGYTPAGGGGVLCPLAAPIAGAPAGSGNELMIIVRALLGGPGLNNWPPGYGIEPSGPYDPNEMPVVDDRYGILTDQQVGLLLSIIGSEFTLAGHPNLAPNNPGALRSYVSLRHQRSWEHVIITGRSFGAAIAAPVRPPTYDAMLKLVDTMSRLWCCDDQWGAAFFRALGDFGRTSCEDHIHGGGVGDDSARAAAAAPGWEVGAPVGPSGGVSVGGITYIDTFAYLFPGTHLAKYSQMGALCQKWKGCDNEVALSFMLRDLRYFASIAQVAAQHNIACGDDDVENGNFQAARADILVAQKCCEGLPKIGKLAMRYTDVKASSLLLLTLKLLRKDGRADHTQFFSMCDIWTLGSIPAGHRWLDIQPMDCPLYWVLETSMRGLHCEVLPVLADHHLACAEEVLTACELVKVRAGLPPVIGVTLDMETGQANVKYVPTTDKSQASHLFKTVRGIGALAWGAMIQQNVPAAGRTFNMGREAVDLQDDSNRVAVGQIMVGYVDGFLRVNSIPLFHGSGKYKCIFRYNINTPGNPRLLPLMDQMRTNVGTESVPMQVRHSSGLVRLPGIGFESNVVGSILDF